MFERYTEKARRVIFFARWEASQLGSLSIDAEHILLGLLKEGSSLLEELLPSDSPADLAIEIRSQSSGSSKATSTSRELPVAPSAARVFTAAMEEADHLLSKKIETRHLLLGILCVEESSAARILSAHGLEIADLRKRFAEASTEGSEPIPKPHVPPPDTAQVLVPDEATAKRIAEAVWIPIFGEERIERQRPLQASRDSSVWSITGSVPDGSDEQPLVALLSPWSGGVLFIGPQPPACIDERSR